MNVLAATESVWNSTGAMVGAIAVAAALLGIALFLVVQPDRRAVRDRIVRFVSTSSSSGTNGRGEEDGLGLLASFETKLEGREWWEKLKLDLDVGRIKPPAGRILAGTLLATLLGLFLIPRLAGTPILAPLALAIPFAARYYIARAARKQREEFADQLADNLQLVASALRSGQSMAGALAVVVEEADEPARMEFRRIVREEQAGVPLEDAIRTVAQRMDNRDLEQVALVAMIQRETGGNTAEILDQVIETIRERRALRSLVSTLTAQGRLSQIIVSALPVALLVGITLINRSYMDPLFETSGGQLALAVGAVLAIVGSLVIRKIVDVRV